MTFLGQAGDAVLETCNPAYTSQTCPACGFVHQENRQGDRFRCRHCWFTAQADTAGTVRHRYRAPALREQITLRQPKERRKQVLMEIFRRRQAPGSPPDLNHPWGIPQGSHGWPRQAIRSILSPVKDSTAAGIRFRVQGIPSPARGWEREDRVGWATATGRTFGVATPPWRKGLWREIVTGSRGGFGRANNPRRGGECGDL